MRAFNRTLLAGLTIPIVSSVALAQNTSIDIRRDTVVPISFDQQLSISRNHVGDPFSATVADPNPDMPQGSRLEGHITEVRMPYENHPGAMSLHFEDVLLPDGSRAPLDAVPVPINAKGIHRDRDGRLIADEKKVRSENVVIGGALGGLLVGSLIGKPFEGTFVGAIAGILAGEATRNDPANTSDIVTRPGSRAGALFQSEFSAPFQTNWNRGQVRDWRAGNSPQGYNQDADFYRRPNFNGAQQNPNPPVFGNPQAPNQNPNEVALEGIGPLSFSRDQQPYWSGDILMVPLQAVAGPMSLTVDAQQGGRIYVENEDNMLRLEQDSKSFRLNGKRGELPAKVESRNGVIFVPVDILADISARPVYVNGTKLVRNP